jgi:hypothetical protein
MKMKKVAVTAAVCAALLGSQGVMAEEQPIGAEGMDFAFDDAQVSSVEMSELSGTEMDATEGAYGPASAATGAVGGAVGGNDGYNATAENPTWGGWGSAVFSGAAGGAVGGFFTPSTSTAAGVGYGAGVASGAATGVTQNAGW